MNYKSKVISEYSYLHPLVSFCYLFGVLLISILTLHPWILICSFLVSFLYEGVLCGMSIWKKNLALQIPVLIFTILIQPLFSHSGITPLFYFNGNPVTKESYLYGCAVCILLFAVIQWCGCMRALLSTDKLLYLSGRILPAAGMILSMVLRYIPLMYHRYREIHDAQRGLGNTIKTTGLIQQFKQYTRELSTLISWSLESTIETSASMEGRGYGLAGRTNYHNYRITTKDLVWIVYQLTVTFTILILIFRGYLSTYYLPKLYLPQSGYQLWVALILYLSLTSAPIFYDLRGKIRWKYLRSKM